MESDQRSMVALKLMRLLDRRVGVENGQTLFGKYGSDLISIIRSAVLSEKVPDDVKATMMSSFTKAANEFQEDLQTRMFPDMERFILGLRALDIPVDRQFQKLKALRDSVEQSNQYGRHLEAEHIHNPKFTIGWEESKRESEKSAQLANEINELWTEIGQLTLTVLANLAGFRAPTSQELVEAFTGNP